MSLIEISKNNRIIKKTIYENTMNTTKIINILLDFIRQNKLTIYGTNSIIVNKNHDIELPINVYSKTPKVHVNQLIKILKKNCDKNDDVKIYMNEFYLYNVSYNYQPIIYMNWINSFLCNNLQNEIIKTNNDNSEHNNNDNDDNNGDNFNLNGIYVMKKIYNYIYLYEKMWDVKNYDDWHNDWIDTILIENEYYPYLHKDVNTHAKIFISYYPMDDNIYNTIYNKFIVGNKNIIVNGTQACRIFVKQMKIKNIIIKKGKFEIYTNNIEEQLEKINEIFGEKNIKFDECKNFFPEYWDKHYRVMYNGKNIIDIYCTNNAYSFNIHNNIQLSNIHGVIYHLLLQNIIINNKKIPELVGNMMLKWKQYLHQNKLSGLEPNKISSIFQNRYIDGALC